jgi:hypothetical protein
VFTGREGDDVVVFNRSGGQDDRITDFGTQYFFARIDAAQEVPTNLRQRVGRSPAHCVAAEPPLTSKLS